MARSRFCWPITAGIWCSGFSRRQRAASYTPINLSTTFLSDSLALSISNSRNSNRTRTVLYSSRFYLLRSSCQCFRLGSVYLVSSAFLDHVAKRGAAITFRLVSCCTMALDRTPKGSFFNSLQVYEQLDLPLVPRSFTDSVSGFRLITDPVSASFL